jgi:hypothetical protein
VISKVPDRFFSRWILYSLVSTCLSIFHTISKSISTKSRKVNSNTADITVKCQFVKVLATSRRKFESTIFCYYFGIFVGFNQKLAPATPGESVPICVSWIEQGLSKIPPI